MLGIANPETDLYLPLPTAGETWDRHTLHTHYFGFQIPEAEIAAFIYIRYLPAFRSRRAGSPSSAARRTSVSSTPSSSTTRR